MESLKEIERLINQHSDVEPLIFQKFVNEELPTCDLESRSLDQLFITIGVALGVYEDEVLDSLNDDPAHGIDNAQLKYELDNFNSIRFIKEEPRVMELLWRGETRFVVAMTDDACRLRAEFLYGEHYREIKITSQKEALNVR